jgi:phosphoribosylamine--glycine ligase
MRLLIIDVGSNGLDLAMRALKAGHEVRWWDRPRKDRSERRAGEGLVDKITDYESVWKKWIGWADLIWLPDNTYYMDRIEPFREIGYPVFGGTPRSTDMELDREVGQQAMKKYGIKTIPTKGFNDHDAALAFVQAHPTYLVSKPGGEADKAMSYVAHDAADLTYMLERWKKNEKYRHDARKHGFILQEKKTGTEMAVGGFYGPGGWSQWFVESFEHKKLMNGDQGPNTGEMGTLARMVKKSKLAEKILLPITPLLKQMDYVGYVDNNAIIDDAGQPWPLEWTMRDGWPLRHNIQSLITNEDPLDWMYDLVMGKDTIQAVDGRLSVSVVMCCPDFPYSHVTAKDLEGIPIYGATDREHVHPSEMMLAEVPVLVGNKVVKMPNYAAAGDYWLIVTGTGDTITGARRSAYAAIERIHAPNSPFYRTDIGRTPRLVTGIPKIQKHGYAQGLSF